MADGTSLVPSAPFLRTFQQLVYNPRRIAGRPRRISGSRKHMHDGCQRLSISVGRRSSGVQVCLYFYYSSSFSFQSTRYISPSLLALFFRTRQHSFIFLYFMISLPSAILRFSPAISSIGWGQPIFSVGRRTQAATRRRHLPPYGPRFPRRSPSDFQTFGDRPAIQEASTQSQSDTAQFLQSELRWHSGAHIRGSHTERKR